MPGDRRELLADGCPGANDEDTTRNLASFSEEDYLLESSRDRGNHRATDAEVARVVRRVWLRQLAGSATGERADNGAEIFRDTASLQRLLAPLRSQRGGEAKRRNTRGESAFGGSFRQLALTGCTGELRSSRTTFGYPRFVADSTGHRDYRPKNEAPVVKPPILDRGCCLDTSAHRNFTINPSGLDRPPPGGGLTTCTHPVPAFTSKEAGISTESDRSLSNLVGT